MPDDHERIIATLLMEELENTVRLGKLVNKLERRIRRLKRKSARQHQQLSYMNRSAREIERRRKEMYDDL